MRPTIEYGERSKHEGKAWDCSCGRRNEPKRKLVFDVPKWECYCGKLYLDSHELDFCLGNIMVNGEPLVQKVFEQIGPECMAYASGQALLMMHIIDCILKNKEVDENVMNLNPQKMVDEYYEKFPLMRDGSTQHGVKPSSSHKFIKMALSLKNKGIELKDGSYYRIGDVCSIHQDNYEEIFETLAGGSPLLSCFYPGAFFGKMEYCCVYSPPEKHVVAQCNKKHPPSKQHSGHMVVLLGPACRGGRLGVYFMNSHGQVFCPREFEVYVPKAVSSGIGKVRVDKLIWNAIKFCRVGESCLGSKLVDEDDGNEVTKYVNKPENKNLLFYHRNV